MDGETEFFVVPCDCGDKECANLTMGIVNPVMKKLTTGEVVPVISMDPGSCGSLIGYLESHLKNLGIKRK